MAVAAFFVFIFCVSFIATIIFLIRKKKYGKRYLKSLAIMVASIILVMVFIEVPPKEQATEVAKEIKEEVKPVEIQEKVEPAKIDEEEKSIKVVEQPKPLPSIIKGEINTVIAKNKSITVTFETNLKNGAIVELTVAHEESADELNKRVTVKDGKAQAVFSPKNWKESTLTIFATFYPEWTDYKQSKELLDIYGEHGEKIIAYNGEKIEGGADFNYWMLEKNNIGYPDDSVIAKIEEKKNKDSIKYLKEQTKGIVLETEIQVIDNETIITVMVVNAWHDTNKADQKKLKNNLGLIIYAAYASQIKTKSWKIIFIDENADYIDTFFQWDLKQ
ncbi:MAG: hypothetical protein LBT51_01540 [Fusobacteriaceae bacterium]|jgi:flagellar hook protein FlgE|nr:hypothetical protein [Fusobacteriaceae bacterium]